jgi:hypothetical protein
MFRSWILRHPTYLLLPTFVFILAFLLNSSSPLAHRMPSLTKIKNYSTLFNPAPQSTNMPRAPVYFFSHGGVRTNHITPKPGNSFRSFTVYCVHSH